MAHAAHGSSSAEGLRWRRLLRAWVLGVGTAVFALVLAMHVVQLVDSGPRLRSLALRARHAIRFAWNKS